MDSGGVSPSPTAALSRPSNAASPLPIHRDDCWTVDATFTLIEAWRERYLALNRHNLSQKHWRKVADAVNFRHGLDRNSIRTGIQCKNRIDTLKKRYKIEKARVLESGGSYVCNWPFLSCLDDLIGDSYKSSTSDDVFNSEASPVTTSGWPFSPVPVGPRSGTKKRPATHVHNFGDSYLRDATSKEDEVTDGQDSERSRSRPKFINREVGYRKLARAIRTISNMYERVEVAKQRHMVELEMQRMQFTKDLDYQRMQILMEMHLQIQKIKQAWGASEAGCYS